MWCQNWGTLDTRGDRAGGHRLIRQQAACNLEVLLSAALSSCISSSSDFYRHHNSLVFYAVYWEFNFSRATAAWLSTPGLAWLVVAVMLRILVANITGSRCGRWGRGPGPATSSNDQSLDHHATNMTTWRIAPPQPQIMFPLHNPVSLCPHYPGLDRWWWWESSLLWPPWWP